jgi:single stranded DNA-binding protein (ssb)
MSASVNQVKLIGNIGRTPELKYLPSGMPVVELSVATTSRRKDKQTGDRLEKTQWHRVVFYGKTAEAVAEYATKSRQVWIEGELDYDSYEKSGVTHYVTKIFGREFQLLGPAPAGACGEPPAGEDDQDDDIPS